jgi:hypothetical protein
MSAEVAKYLRRARPKGNVFSVLSLPSPKRSRFGFAQAGVSPWLTRSIAALGKAPAVDAE